MEEKEENNLYRLKAEKNLEKFISLNYKKYSLESLKKEAIKKGYGESLFLEVYDKIKKREKITPQAIPVPKKQVNKVERRDGKDFLLVPIEKEKLARILKESNSPIGTFFTPTQIMTYVFCILLLGAIGFSLYDSFYLESFTFDDGGQDMAGKASSFKMGYPLVFISFSFADDNPFVFDFWKFLLDFSIYIFLAYIIDLTLSNSFRIIKKAIDKDIKKEAKQVEKENKVVSPIEKNNKDFVQKQPVNKRKIVSWAKSNNGNTL